jgi:hypothetical protein
VVLVLPFAQHHQVALLDLRETRSRVAQDDVVGVHLELVGIEVVQQDARAIVPVRVVALVEGFGGGPDERRELREMRSREVRQAPKS